VNIPTHPIQRVAEKHGLRFWAHLGSLGVDLAPGHLGPFVAACILAATTEVDREALARAWWEHETETQEGLVVVHFPEADPTKKPLNLLREDPRLFQKASRYYKRHCERYGLEFEPPSCLHSTIKRIDGVALLMLRDEHEGALARYISSGNRSLRYLDRGAFA
jgi:hypothetical protein